MATQGETLFRQHQLQRLPRRRTRRSGPRCSTGVYGRQVPIAGRQGRRFVTADERYIRDSILLPKSQVVAGYEPVMPSFKGQINEDDLLKIIAYIKSIGGRSRGGAAMSRCRRAGRRRPSRELPRPPATRVKSWLLTTDHKRIAHPVHDLDHALLLHRRRRGHADAAGADDARRATSSSPRPTTSCSRCTASMMVFFFLIPSIPAVLGQLPRCR